jgi:hypothetical protein
LGVCAHTQSESVVVQIAFGQPGVTRTPAALAAVDVSPHGERIEGHIGELARLCDAVSVEHRCQMVSV